jgi:hypothetical protein
VPAEAVAVSVAQRCCAEPQPELLQQVWPQGYSLEMQLGRRRSREPPSSQPLLATLPHIRHGNQRVSATEPQQPWLSLWMPERPMAPSSQAQQQPKRRQKGSLDQDPPQAVAQVQAWPACLELLFAEHAQAQPLPNRRALSCQQPHR